MICGIIDVQTVFAFVNSFLSSLALKLGIILLISILLINLIYALTILEKSFVFTYRMLKYGSFSHLVKVFVMYVK